MAEGALILPPESEIERMMAAIMPDIRTSLGNVRVNPNLPFGDLFPDIQDWILDDIIGWIASLWDYITKALGSLLASIMQGIANIIMPSIEVFFRSSNTLLEIINRNLGPILHNVEGITGQLAATGQNIIQQISQASAGIIHSVTMAMGSAVTDITHLINTINSSIFSIVSTISNGILSVVGPWIQNILNWSGQIIDLINKAVMPYLDRILNFMLELPGQIATSMVTLTKGIADIPGLVLEGILDVGQKLGGALTDWLDKDLHEANKEMEDVEDFEELAKGSPVFAVIAQWVGRLLGIVWPWLLKNLMPQVAKALPGLAAFIGIEVLSETGELEKLVDKYITPAFTGITSHFESMGAMSPTPGGSITEPLTKIISVTIEGLSAFCLGGGLLGIFKQTGMGVISAMIYDLINFKTLTGAYMAQLANVYISQPLKYYYNALARPQLPGQGDLISMASEYALASYGGNVLPAISIESIDEINQANKQVFVDSMKYHGYSDAWCNLYYELADTPARYFALRGMADAGIYDETYFVRELMNNGHNPDTIRHMLDMLRKFARAEVKSRFLTTIVNRYKEGLTNEAQYSTELLAVGIGEEQLESYIYGANLTYQYDYAMDLITAYRTQYQKGMIPESEFTDRLAALGLAPDRITQNVIKVQAAVFKPPKAAVPATPVPQYLTDEGQVLVNAEKEAFRKNLSSAEELYARLIDLEMPPDLAEAISQYEIIKKMPKAPAE